MINFIKWIAGAFSDPEMNLVNIMKSLTIIFGSLFLLVVFTIAMVASDFLLIPFLLIIMLAYLIYEYNKEKKNDSP